MDRQECGADERASWKRWTGAEHAVDEERASESGHGKVSESPTYGRRGLTFRFCRLGEMMQNLYRDDNPEGIISLGVAENSLMVCYSPPLGMTSDCLASRQKNLPNSTVSRFPNSSVNRT